LHKIFAAQWALSAKTALLANKSGRNSRPARRKGVRSRLFRYRENRKVADRTHQEISMKSAKIEEKCIFPMSEKHGVANG